MLICIGGYHGSGRTTTAKLLAKQLRFRYVCVGDIARKLASEKNMSIEEFNKYLEKHLDVDKKIDRLALKEARKGNVILDSNLGGHLTKANLKVWLTAPIEIRAKRRIKKHRFGDIRTRTLTQSIKELKKREMSERKRYKKMYDVDLFDLSNYDLIINTSRWKPKKVVNIILCAIK